MDRFGLVIHGGAGTLVRSELTPERDAVYRETLTEALDAGYEVLRAGGTSLDAVVSAVVVLEDSPLFNAGKGACFTSSGINELDASLMDGKELRAGAAAAVKRVKNPIRLAREVLEHSGHVFLAGEGADAFAELRGLDMVPPEYFYTEARYRAMQRLKQQGLDETALSEDTALEHTLGPPAEPDKLGTVGAAALDRAGNLAAGTSTGGTTNKRFGRVGDSPLLGAGNYANNRSCAVSCTGEGEFFMRLLAAYDVSALMEYRGLGLEQAAREVVMQKVTRLGGRGGLVAIDRAGRVAMPFNTPGMYRGHIDAAGRRLVAVYEQ